MIRGFAAARVAAAGSTFSVHTAGHGPAVLLLHGYPQTHLIWRHLAPAWAQRFAVVAPDLKGYGASDAPAPAPDSSNYSKRAMAAELVALMRALGHERFAVVGHDRGGRVAYRLALDHPQAVTRLVTLDIIPTGASLGGGDARVRDQYLSLGFPRAGRGHARAADRRRSGCLARVLLPQVGARRRRRSPTRSTSTSARSGSRR